MDTITITVAENDPDVIVSATLNEDAVTITLNEAATGATGVGVASGGSANDILKKTSSTDYDTEWETPTSAATANTIVRRDETGGAFFGGDVGAPKYRGNFYQAESATEGASLRNSAGTAYLTWGATAGNISITVDTTSTGHFYSAPSTSIAGHFVTKNGTAPTIVAGRSAWYSNATGDPQFRNGTGSAVTLIYSGGALGTPASGTLTSCTGLPVSTGISGLGSNVATFLSSPSAVNFQNMMPDYTGTGNVVMEHGPVITNINLNSTANFNATTYTYGIGAASAHRTALGLTELATTTPGTGVATFLATPSSANLRAAVTDETGTGSLVFATAPSVTNLTTDQLTLSGNISSAAWTTNGLRIKGVAATLTDTTSTGTVAAAYTDAFGGNTIAATNSTTFTNYTTAFFREPTAGTNVTMTNKWAIGAESARIGTSNQLTISTSGVLTATSPVFTTPALGTPSSLVVTNATGTASININGTVGATTRDTGAFTTLAANGATTLTAGTASTSSTTGTLVVTGGVGISGAIYTANRIWTNSGGAPVVLGGLAVGDGVYGGLWINQASPSSSNYSFLGQAGQSLFNATAGGTVELRVSNGAIMNVGTNGVGIGLGNSTAPTILFEVKATTTRFSVSNAGNISFEKTIIAAGTTGAQTINKASGSVNFAAAATSLVVTNSLCTTSSVINATIATNDATASGLRVVAGTGSFTIYMLVAPTAETRVNFFLTN